VPQSTRVVSLVQRGGTAAQWAAENTVLLERQLGIETDTYKGKVGDGTTPWNSLPYVIGPSVSGGSGIEFVTFPSSETASGSPGQMSYDAASGYLAICVANNSWIFIAAGNVAP